MKYLIVSFALCMTSLVGYAQFTITYNDHYPTTNTENFYTALVNPEDFDVWAGGADGVWDFSELETGTQLWVRYLPVDSGQVPNEFVNAEFMDWSELLFGGDFQEAYNSIGPDGVYFEGYFSQTWKFTYTEPRLSFPFPMDYGDVIVDQWEAEVEHQITLQQNDRVGETTFEYDGYGTLILPHVTFDDAVRVHSVAEYVDVIDGMEFSYTETRVDWYVDGYKHIVASVSTLDGELVFFPVTRVLFLRNPDDIVPDVELLAQASIDEICANECVTIENLTDTTIFEDNHELTWQWTFPGGTPETFIGMNPPEICYDSSGVYPILLELDVNGQLFQTLFEDEVTVIEGCGPVANFEYTPVVCLGQCYDFENTSINATDHFWTFEGAVPETSEEIHPQEVCYLDQTGTFNVTLTVMNDNGSSTSITQQVTVVNPPSVNAGPDQTIIQGTNTVLSVIAGNGTGQYIWQPFEDVTCFSCPATSTYPLQETTTFVVYYEQSGGCQSSDTLTVFVEESFLFGLPGSFSPNGDGINDVLYVRGSNISQMNLQLYDRYGQKVFESNNQKNGWDGTQNGRPLNAGVFGYVLEVTQSDGNRQVISGDVSLIR